MSEISRKTKNLRSDAEMWGMLSTKLTNDMLNLKVIQKMFKELGKGFDPKVAEEWLKEHYKDDPNTTKDESVSYKQLEGLVDKFGGGKPGQDDLSQLNEDSVKGMFRNIWARREMVYMQVDAIQDQIDDLALINDETITGESLGNEGGGADSETSI